MTPSQNYLKCIAHLMSTSALYDRHCILVSGVCNAIKLPISKYNGYVTSNNLFLSLNCLILHKTHQYAIML